MRVLTVIERRINHLLALDEEAIGRLAALSGQVIVLELVNTAFIVYILPGAGGLHLQTDYAAEANVKIRGTPTDLLAYLLTAKQRAGSFSGSLEIIGDVGLAQAFQSIMVNLDLDWEEQLAKCFGDTLAHAMGRAIRGGARFAKNSGEKLQADVSEYLRFEQGLTVDKSEMSEFDSEVDILRNDLERLKLRIKRLEEINGEETTAC